MKKEENPFEEKQVAEEWINSVENEEGQVRDRDIYPRLNNWVNKIKPSTLIEIGSGQGICSDKISYDYEKYIGVEPSITLTNRAKVKYSNENRDFIIGNAYDIPLSDNKYESVFSVNVWFHLENLDRASKELSRILKKNGNFLIITSNPNQHDVWESFFFDYEKKDKKIDGKVKIPINDLSRNIIYTHTISEIKESLENSGLTIEKIEEFGVSSKPGGHKELFISIEGSKI